MINYVSDIFERGAVCPPAVTLEMNPVKKQQPVGFSLTSTGTDKMRITIQRYMNS